MARLFCLLASLQLTTALVEHAPYNKTLKWQPCTAVGHNEYKRVECADFTVPIDWNNCSSEPLRLTTARVLSTTNNTGPMPNFFIRSGGPGIYTSSQLISIAQGSAVFAEILQHFNVIVLDERGTGFNYPVTCDPGPWNEFVNLFPSNEAEYNATIEAYGRAGENCLAKTGPVMNYMDTLTYAKDLEALRIALDEPLTIYALSWGSQAISQYVNLFPDNIRAVILDGIVSHTVSNVEIGQSEITYLSLATQRALGWASTNETSPLYGRDAVQLYRDLIQRARHSPFPIPQCNDTVCIRNVVGAQEILGASEGWTEYPLEGEAFLKLATVLAAAEKGNLTYFAVLKWTEESMKASNPNGTLWTEMAIACQDWIPDANWTAYDNWQNMVSTNAVPVDHGFFGLVQLACPRWPTAVRNPPAPINVSPSAPVLIVNALWDPATGYDQAVLMQRQIHGSVLLTRNGEGHGSWSFSFPETLSIMLDYLIDLKLPPLGTVTDQPVGTFDTFVRGK